MCGLVGFLSCDFDSERGQHTLQRMCDKIIHRGPDDSDIWFDETQQIGLGHQRLSILDLSPAGSQPMLSSSGRYVIAFNGEIYNHLQLRQELGKDISWRGNSDTETLLAGFDFWGIEESIKRSVGMFAFAVWDKKYHVLTLGRDRIGEKPLYYGWQQDHFLFGSELKALKAHPAFNADINRDALALFMRHNAIAAPHCIWQDISKLQPGCLLTVSHINKKPVIRRYWSIEEASQLGSRTPFSGSPEEAVSALEKILCDSIDIQMMADVPVGAFLSGGVDSSTIVALMQARSTKPIRSFSIGFNEAHYNEAEYAKAVARHLGTKHTELYVSSEDALNVIPKLPHLYDEPFADSSQIPSFLVAQLAKQQVTVALTGDGGDELFCGYSRYLMVEHIWRLISKMPLKVRRVAGKGLLGIPPEWLNRISMPMARVLPAHLKVGLWGDKLHKGAAALSSASMMALYHRIVSHWQDPTQLVLGANELSTCFDNAHDFSYLSTDLDRMMIMDMLTYLPDDILTKVDRAAMGSSLETRVPLLDHRVIEFALSLPLEFKIRNGQTKWILREILHKYVPKTLIDRPKMGFGVPVGAWLRGPLREWAEALLDRQRLKEEGFFDPSMICKKWEEHVTGRFNWQYLLWDVLMFQSWLEVNR